MNDIYITKEIKDGIWYVGEGGLDAMYIIKGSEKGLVIDTGTGVQDFKQLIERLLSTPYDVVLTHGHVDHAGGVSQFDKVYIHNEDQDLAEAVTLEQRVNYIRQMKQVKASAVEPQDMINILKTDKKPEYVSVHNGYVFELGDRSLRVLHCPGHTQGSIMLLDEQDKILFSGDSVNDTELICAPGKNRRQVLLHWYEAVNDAFVQKDKFDLCCGGHNVFSREQGEDTVECGRKLLQGEIQTEKVHLHIFYGNFAKYKSITITTDENIVHI